MKVAFVVGARPQFIKMALIAKEFQQRGHSKFVIHTDQHYDYLLSKSFFDQLDIEDPEYHLGIGSGTHGKQTGEMLKSIEEVLMKEQPDLVVVFGDTNSTLAGSLAATKLHIKIAHVEAGLRNFDRKKPEEINRIVTDHISDFFFAPSENAKQNLAAEGITKDVFIVGDISNDVLLRNVSIAEKNSDFLKTNALEAGTYFLLTVHKSKNTDSKKNLSAIINGVAELSERIIFPIHPRTRKMLHEYGLEEVVEQSNIELIDPLTYFDMISALKNAHKIITDSGGIQKEAYALKVPCITLRKTEWIETVQDGWNVEVDIHDKKDLVATIRNFSPSTPQSGFLGNGDTYKLITDILCEKMS